MNAFRKYLSVTLCAAVFCSCDTSVHTEYPDSPGEVYVEHGMMVLGRQLEDPYSVSNITKALESLYPTKAGSVNVSATDLYVRFLPSGEAQ